MSMYVLPNGYNDNLELYFEGVKIFETIQDDIALYGETEDWHDKMLRLLDEYEKMKSVPNDWETIRNGLLDEEKNEFIKDEEIFI